MRLDELEHSYKSEDRKGLFRETMDENVSPV